MLNRQADVPFTEPVQAKQVFVNGLQCCQAEFQQKFSEPNSRRSKTEK